MPSAAKESTKSMKNEEYEKDTYIIGNAHDIGYGTDVMQRR